MDIFSIIIVCVALYGMAKRAPGLIGEAVAEFQAGLHGKTTQPAQDRRQRLIDAGVDPATGGPFRQFVGNTWRDYWIDKDRERQDRRQRTPDDTVPPQDGPGWWGRLRDRLDDAVERQAGKWRNRQDGPSGADGQGGQATTSPEFDTDLQDITTGPDAPETPASEAPETPTTDDAATPRQRSGPMGPISTTDRSPIVVDAYLGEPTSLPAGTVTAVLDPPGTNQQLEGTPPMSGLATRGAAVTGVVSGAAEARSIQAALGAATAEYAAAVARARNRIQSMGEQTLSTVQMAGRSTVVQACAQAAEAIASAQSSVNSCSEEVIPLLGRVAREFDKRNS